MTPSPQARTGPGHTYLIHLGNQRLCRDQCVIPPQSSGASRSPLFGMLRDIARPCAHLKYKTMVTAPVLRLRDTNPSPGLVEGPPRDEAAAD